jgi:two-component system phosphate regulon sensor histidine kinase PhoR
MSLSRIEADKHRLPTEMIVMSDLVAEVLSVARQNLGERGGDIVSAIGDDLPPVQGDRLQIGQLLHNLMSNSAKYGRPGTPITVQARAVEPGMIRLEVSDEGEGIQPDHLPRLTERFYRVDSGRSRALGGTGLGLAIVKHIVERHRGRLDIASVMGKGTTVSVLLPQADRNDERDSKDTENSAPETLS